MPMDLIITYNDGSQTYVNIPLRMMRGNKPNEFQNMQYILAEDWPWTHPNYDLEIQMSMESIKSIEIDPSYRMGDVNSINNTWMP